jgi:hypothetical protein
MLKKGKARVKTDWQTRRLDYREPPICQATGSKASIP